MKSVLAPTHASAAAAVRYAISALETALSKSRFLAGRNGRIYRIFGRDMPYAIRDTKLPNTQILVNGHKMPMGRTGNYSTEWVRYEDYSNLHVHLTPQEIASIVCPANGFGLFGKDPHALYCDATAPWRGRQPATEYRCRLKHLLELLVAATPAISIAAEPKLGRPSEFSIRAQTVARQFQATGGCSTPAYLF